MDKRIVSLFLGSVGMLSGCVNVIEVPLPQTPNLLIIFPDQWRASSFGFRGEPVKTPNLDLFAKQSIVFDQCVSNQPLCSPFRGMLMSGQYPIRNSVWGNCQSMTAPFGCELPSWTVCWSDILNLEGYELGYIGKWHLDSPHEPYINCRNNKGDLKWNEWCPPDRRHSFKYWHAYGTYDDHLQPMYWSTNAKRDEYQFVKQWGPEYETDRAIEFLRNSNNTRNANYPFALVVSINPPHPGYNLVPQKYKNVYSDLEIESLCAKYPQIPPKGTEYGDYYRQNIRNYYACITGVDEQIGRLLKTLEETNLDKNTVVVFVSDHGDCLGHHGLVGKNTFYEEAFQIPLMIRHPGIAPHHEDALISAPDLYPTILGLLGFSHRIPEQVQGVDYSKLIAMENDFKPEGQLYYFVSDRNLKKAPDFKTGRRGWRTARYTLVIERMENSVEKIILFDRQTDPFQLTNVADQNPEVVKNLKIAMEKEMKRLDDPWNK